MTSSPRWIVSPTYDLAFFIGGVLVSLFFLLLYETLIHFAGMNPVAAAVIVQMIFFYGLDQPHVFQTGARVYASPEQFARVKSLATWGLGALLLATVGLTYAGEAGVFYLLFSIIGSWHIIRQNVGFIKAYKRLNDDRDPVDAWIDSGSYYVIMLGCLVRAASQMRWENFQLDRRALSALGLLGRPLLPAWCDTLAVCLSLAAVGVFTWWQIHRLVSGRGVNGPKILLMAATALTHVAVFYVVALPALITVLETAYHDVQYHAWMAHYQRRRFTGIPRVRTRWLAAALAYGIAALALTSFGDGVTGYVGNLFLAVILFHYLIDARIWSFSTDPHLRHLMLPAPAPAAAEKRCDFGDLGRSAQIDFAGPPP